MLKKNYCSWDLGAVRLAKRKSSKRWKDQVIEFHTLGDDGIESVDLMMQKIGLKPGASG